MVSCSLRGCTSRTGVNKKSQGITFHRFPKKTARQQDWIAFVKRNPDWKPSKSSSLCSKHFEEKFFDKTSQCVVRLRENAVPTIPLSWVEDATITREIVCATAYYRSGTGSGVCWNRPYVGFPTDIENRNEWLGALGLPLNHDVDKMKICSLHFKTTNYYNPYAKRRVLNKGAVPSIFTPDAMEQRAIAGALTSTAAAVPFSVHPTVVPSKSFSTTDNFVIQDAMERGRNTLPGHAIAATTSTADPPRLHDAPAEVGLLARPSVGPIVTFSARDDTGIQGEHSSSIVMAHKVEPVESVHAEAEFICNTSEFDTSIGETFKTEDTSCKIEIKEEVLDSNSVEDSSETSGKIKIEEQLDCPRIINISTVTWGYIDHES